MSPRTIAALVCVVLLSSCSFWSNKGGYYKGDGPPSYKGPDLATIPDAIPRIEPLSQTGNSPYRALGKTYRPLHSAQGYRARGMASWYGNKFHGRRTSSGETYDMFKMTAAHPTLPIPSYVKVANLSNGRSVVVRVNDRGPFLHGRIIDLSYVAAAKLGVLATGTAPVEVTAVSPAPVLQEAKIEAPVTQVTQDVSVEPRLFVQVGAFTNRFNAEVVYNRLTGAGFAPVAIQEVLIGKSRIFRVRVGPVESITQGDQLIDRMYGYGMREQRLVID